MTVLRRGAFGVLLAACLVVVTAFFAIPLVALFTQVPLHKVPSLLKDKVVRDALRVTLRTNLVANALMLGLGTPAAYLLATRRFPGRAVLITLLEVPLVLPPAVAGISMLAAFGAMGMLGERMQSHGIFLPFTEWAVIFAIVFVAAPLYLRQAIAAFEGVDRNLVDAARTLGAGPARVFWRISMPLASAGLTAGFVIAFARGLGEFGATIVFAGNVAGRTQTLTLAIYQELDENFDVALSIGVLMVSLSAALLLASKGVVAWRSRSMSA